MAQVFNAKVSSGTTNGVKGSTGTKNKFPSISCLITVTQECKGKDQTSLLAADRGYEDQKALFHSRTTIRRRNTITIFEDGDYNLALTDCTGSQHQSDCAEGGSVIYFPVPSRLTFTVRGARNDRAASVPTIGSITLVPETAVTTLTTYPAAVSETETSSTFLFGTLIFLFSILAVVVGSLAWRWMLTASKRTSSPPSVDPLTKHRQDIGWVWQKDDDSEPELEELVNINLNQTAEARTATQVAPRVIDPSVPLGTSGVALQSAAGLTRVTIDTKMQKTEKVKSGGQPAQELVTPPRVSRHAAARDSIVEHKETCCESGNSVSKPLRPELDQEVLLLRSPETDEDWRAFFDEVYSKNDSAAG